MDYAGIICILIGIVIFFIIKTIKYYKHKKLLELVAWSANSPMPDLTLPIEVSESRYSIPLQYRINKATEQDFVEEILREYQSHIAKLYYSNRLQLIKSKYVFTAEDYFMASLHDFLSAKSESVMFSDHFLYRSKNDGNETKHIMTDFGIAFYKLYYITRTYCKQHPRFNNRFSHWVDTDITSVLDTKEY